MVTPLLSAFYFGSVEHYRLIAASERIIIDVGEHYERQSYRNRTSIIGPNGRNDLVVQIGRRSGEKMPMRSVGLSYKESWPQQHLHAIRSAYGKAPWFIHYIDAIEATVLRKYERLIELDLATMRLAMNWLGLGTEVVVSENYVEVVSPGVVSRGSPDGLTTHNLNPAHDFRTSFHPKRPLPIGIAPVARYPQVFSERHGFVARMSIIDLVCNCGPRALEHLRA